MVGELPYRTNPPTNTQSYSCVFGMQQVVEVTSTSVSEATTLFWNGEKGTDGSDRTDREVGYITEGTNDVQKGNIEITSSAIRPSNDMQQWLSGKEASEYGGSGLWSNFNRSTNNEWNRNPWQACVNQGDCAVAGN